MREAIATIRLSLARLEGFGARRSGRLEVRDALGVESEHVGQNFVRMLAQKRRAFDPDYVVRELHRQPDCDVFSTLRMINLHESAGGIERVILENIFHRKDGTAWDVLLVQDVHQLELGIADSP